jgi:hypothetical protein
MPLGFCPNVSADLYYVTYPLAAAASAVRLASVLAACGALAAVLLWLPSLLLWLLLLVLSFPR